MVGYSSFRGPRPQSAKWPAKGQVTSKAPSKSRRGSQVADTQSVGQRGQPPEEVVMNARARVAKLEAAMAALGEADPTYLALQEALTKAKAQSQVRPVEERIASSKVLKNKDWPKAKHVWRLRGIEGGEFRPPCQPILPANWRNCGVQELREENSDFRSKLQSGVRGGEERDKQAKSVQFHSRFGPIAEDLCGPSRTRSVSESAHCMAVVVRMPLRGWRP